MNLSEHNNDTNIRAGILIRLSGTDKILIEHATGKYPPMMCMDIPKGHITTGEDIAEGACREVFEETGIDIDPSEIIKLGTYAYNRGPLQLFYVEKDFNIKDCYCESKFKSQSGEMLPEVDRYELFDMRTDDLDKSLIYKNLKPILKNEFEKILNK